MIDITLGIIAYAIKILMNRYNSFMRKKCAHNLHPAKRVEDFNC